MTDRNMIIRGCENWVNNHKDEDLLLEYSSVVELLALLKEQQNQIWEMQDRTEYLEDKLKEQPEIVQCKDCKWWDKKKGSPYGYCHACQHGYFSQNWDIEIYRTYKGDWFCAEGERRK